MAPLRIGKVIDLMPRLGRYLVSGENEPELPKMIVRHFLAGELARLVIGGTLGGFVGWTLNSRGVASDPENFWAICVLAGVALGLVLGGAVMAWSGRGVPGKVQSVIAGAGCWVALASALLTWVIWTRRV